MLTPSRTYSTWKTGEGNKKQADVALKFKIFNIYSIWNERDTRYVSLYTSAQKFRFHRFYYHEMNRR